MIEELELENVKGIRQVSAAWWPRLAALFSSLPFHIALPIVPPRSPVEILDLVYEAQAGLFAIKNERVHTRRAQMAVASLMPAVRQDRDREGQDDWGALEPPSTVSTSSPARPGSNGSPDISRR
jgi:hypothetical protein